VVKRNKINQL